MLAKKVFKNIVYNSSSVLMSNIVGLIITIYVARVLNPELFGVYSLVLSIAFLFLTFTDLGINATLIRYVARAHGLKDYELVRGYIKSLSKLKLVLSIFASALLFLLSGILSTHIFHEPLLYTPLKVISAFVLFFSLLDFVNSIFNAFNDFKANLIRAFVYESSRLILIILLVSIGLSVIGALLGFVIASFLALIVLLMLLVRRYRFFIFGKAKKINWRRVIRFASYLTLGSITWVVFAYVDSVMIGMFLPVEYVGYYRVAYNIVGAIAGLVSIPVVLFPIFVQLEGKDLKRAFDRAFKYSAIISFPVVFGLTALSEELIKLVYGVEYLKAVPVLMVLSLLILRSSLGFWGVIFNAKEKPEYPVYVTFIAMIINIVLNYFLILKWGIVGASIATIISNAFSWLFLAFLSKKMFGIFFRADHLVKSFVAGLVIFLILSFVKIDNIVTGIIYVLVCGIVYLLLLITTKCLTKEDVEYVKKVIFSS